MIKVHGKKAQVTIFVILGIILVAGVFFFLASQNKDDSLDFGDQADLKAILTNINSYSTNCFSDVVEKSIEDVLRQGGYYSLDDVVSDEVGSFAIPFYLKDNLKSMPLEAEVLEAIRLMVVDNFDSCVDDYSAFEDFDVTLEKSSTSADIESKEGILISLNPNLQVLHDDSSIASDNLTEFVPLDIEPLLASADEIVEAHVGFDSGYLSLTRTSDAVDRYELVFDALSYDNNALVMLKDDEDSNYVLLFLMELD